MTRKPLTQEQAIEFYTELQRRVSVGAYLELEHDGSFPEDDGSAESTTLESLHNLESWAERQGLEFAWDNESKGWHLQPMSEPPDLVQEMYDRIDHDMLTHPGEQDEESEV